MKKRVLFLALAMLSFTFLSCEKNSSEPANYLKIEGSFTIGEKEFINPTFNLGEPEEHEGYFVYFPQKENNAIEIIPTQAFDVGDNLLLMYYMQLNTAQVGSAQMEGNIRIYPEEGEPFIISCEGIDANITKIDEVEGYIEGSFQGDYYISLTKVLPYHVKGKFRVKIADQIN